VLARIKNLVGSLLACSLERSVALRSWLAVDKPTERRNINHGHRALDQLLLLLGSQLRSRVHLVTWVSNGVLCEKIFVSMSVFSLS
jgi:hypothetical protein